MPTLFTSKTTISLFHIPYPKIFVALFTSINTGPICKFWHSVAFPKLRKPEPKCQTILYFAAARDNVGGAGDNWNSRKMEDVQITTINVVTVSFYRFSFSALTLSVGQ